MTGGEHFDWAVRRAQHYTDQGGGYQAIASLVVDLSRHPATAHILTPELLAQFAAAVHHQGTQGAQQFIDQLPRPD